MLSLIEDSNLFLSGKLEMDLNGLTIFFIWSALFGLLYFLANLCYQIYINYEDRYNIKIKYIDFIYGILLLFAFIIGPGVVGTIAVFLHILDFHPIGSASVAVTWPFILEKLYKRVKEVEETGGDK